MMEIDIPDTEGIREIIKKLETMDKEDLIANNAFHSVALSAMFKAADMTPDDVLAFCDIISEKINRAFDEKERKNYS